MVAPGFMNPVLTRPASPLPCAMLLCVSLSLDLASDPIFLQPDFTLKAASPVSGKTERTIIRTLHKTFRLGIETGQLEDQCPTDKYACVQLLGPLQLDKADARCIPFMGDDRELAPPDAGIYVHG